MPGKVRIRRRWIFLLAALCLMAVAVLGLSRPCLVEYRLWQARRSLAEHDVQQALVWLHGAERLDRDRGKTQFWLARAHRRLGQSEQVREHLARALRLGHSAEAIEREEVLTLAQAGQLDPADPRVSTLMLDARGDTLEIYEAVVRGYLETFHVGPALVLLDAWEADAPADPQSHFYRGLIWSHQEEWSQALMAFQRALELAPERSDVRLHLARALREDYRYRESLGLYRRCLEENEEPEALFGCGLCLETLGETDEAREVYLRLLAKAPDHFEGRLAIGKLDFSFGSAAEAVEWLGPAARQRPFDVDVRQALAWALLSTGHKDQARGHFQFAVKAQEASLRVRNLTRRVEVEPDNVELRHEIGKILLQYGQPSTGLAWLGSVLNLDPRHVPTHSALADYYSQQANHAMAAKHGRLAAGPE